MALASVKVTSKPLNITVPKSLPVSFRVMAWTAPSLAVKSAVPVTVTAEAALWVIVPKVFRLKVTMLPPDNSVALSSSIITVPPEAERLPKFTVSPTTVPRVILFAPAFSTAAPVTVIMFAAVLLMLPPVVTVRSTAVLILPRITESTSLSVAVPRFARVTVPKSLTALSKVRLLAAPPRSTFRIPPTTTSAPAAPSSTVPPAVKVAPARVRISVGCTFQPSES